MVFGYFVGNDRPYVSQGTDVVKSRPTNFTDYTIHCKVIIKSDSQNFYLFFRVAVVSATLTVVMSI